MLLFNNHEGMLSTRRERILNEAAGIGTFLLKGLLAASGSLKKRLATVFDDLLFVGGLSALSSAPAGATSLSDAGNAAKDDSGRKTLSQWRFPIAEVGSRDAYALLVPGVGLKDSCGAE